MSGARHMNTREGALTFCHTFKNIIEDYPFYDANWALMRHKENKKTFACIYGHEDNIWIDC